MTTITKVRFGILSEEELSNLSVLELSSKTLSKDNSIANALSSDKLGPVEPDFKCPTCLKSTNNCAGHFAKIKLSTPVVHPLAVMTQDVVSYLNIFCSGCKQLIMGKDHLILNNIDKYTGLQRRKKIEVATSKLFECTHENCKTIVFRYEIDRKTKKIYRFYDVNKNKKENRSVITPSEIYEIFRAIPHEELVLAGLNPSLVHPKDFIFHSLPVLPPISRPYIITDGERCNDDLTDIYTQIVKTGEKKLSVEETEDITSRLIHAIMDNSAGLVKRANGVPKKGIKQRTDGKKGHVRYEQQGKRVDYTARTVIVGDSYISTGEIGIPQWIAEIVTAAEIVNKFNFESLSELVNSGKAEAVTRGEHYQLLSFPLWKRATSLQWGDRIMISSSPVTRLLTPDIKYFITEIPDGFCLSEGNVIIRGSSITYLTYLSSIREGMFRLIGNEKIITRDKQQYLIKQHPSGAYIVREGDIIVRQDRQVYVSSEALCAPAYDANEPARAAELKRDANEPLRVKHDTQHPEVEEYSSQSIFLYMEANGAGTLYSTKPGPLTRQGPYGPLPDAILSGGRAIETVIPQRRTYLLQEGDIVHRHLKDGDPLICNRQPTLHRGSMMMHRAKLFPYVSSLSSRTIQLPHAVTSPYNADFDGDEFNLHVPQTSMERAELEETAVENNIISGSGVIIGCIQNCILAAYLMSVKNTVLERGDFYQIAIGAGLEVTGEELELSSYGLLSLVFPHDFNLKVEVIGGKKGEELCIQKGRFISGILNKNFLGPTRGSIQHYLAKEYSNKRALLFIDQIQYLTREWLIHFPHSIGINDCMTYKKVASNPHGSALHSNELANPNGSVEDVYIEETEEDITKREADAKVDLLKKFISSNKDRSPIESLIEKDLYEEEQMALLNSVTATIQKNTLDAVYNNNILPMIRSKAKGSLDNLMQICGSLGQQNYLGGRIPLAVSGYKRSLSCFPLGKTTPETRGFIASSFFKGLNPYELWFHAACGRAGVLNTSAATPKTGYDQRCMSQFLSSLKVAYDNSVRDDQERIVQFIYGDDGILPEHMLSVKTASASSNDKAVNSFIELQRFVDKIEEI